MATDSQQLRDRLLQTDEEFRQLIAKHQELDTPFISLVASLTFLDRNRWSK